MTAYHGRMAWRARREEEVPEMIGSKGLNLRDEVAWKDRVLMGEVFARSIGEERMCDVRFEVRGRARRRRICAIVAGVRELRAQFAG